IRRKPYSVVLFDEIEKAHPDVFNILLQVLDDGRLTDNKGRVVNFKNTIIIMTSNLGSQIIRERFESLTEANRDEVVSKSRDEVMELLKRTIRPEFLNRVDEVIMFTPLTLSEIRNVVYIQINGIQKMLCHNGMRIDFDDSVLDYLANEGYDPQFGARPVKRVIQRQLLNELSKAILSGVIDKECNIYVTMHDGVLTFANR
ncbi:MAG: AAA family ATPase, partial [Bacteroidales bacterium]